MLGIEADLELVDDLEGGRVDHVHVVRLHVRDVDALERALDGVAQLAGNLLAIEIGRIHDRRHSGNRLDLRVGFAKGEAEGGEEEGAAESFFEAHFGGSNRESPNSTGARPLS